MSFTDFQSRVHITRRDSETKRLDLKSAKQQADKLARNRAQRLREIPAADHASDEQLAEIARAEKELNAAIAQGKSDYRNALAEEWGVLTEFLDFTNPLEHLAGLSDDCPILLFPLRLETRFKRVEGDEGMQDQLWVRVFPDDIAINSFESDLSDSEIRNAQAYWLARWSAGKDLDGNRGAWRALASAHGPGRAYWLISNDNYVPLNLSDEPEKAEGEIILAIGTETPLTDPEDGALVSYWQEVWQADKDNTRLEAAWDSLLDVVNEERATELIKNYQPANLMDPPRAGMTRDETVVRVELVIFKPADTLESKLHAWSQPPTTSILPERFVFLAYHDDALDMPPQVGNLVPPSLMLGPDPAAAEGEDLRLATVEDAAADTSIQEGDLIFAEHLRWMFDFDEAVARGMGFRINLTLEQAERGFDRVFVVGIKLSADKSTGKTLLEELFAQHQHSRKGLSIVRQGTPTNNTEDDPSGYSWRHDPDESFDVYFGDALEQPDPVDWYNKSDGRWLAELLGLDPLGLRTVENYYATDIVEGKAMQRAVWPATLGHFMESMMNPVFRAETIEQTRQFFTRYVSGRGCLPVIRVGKQPYGILPASNYTRLEWFRPRHTPTHFTTAALFDPGNPYLLMLYQILLDMDQTWTTQLDKVAHVGKTGDPHQLLLDIIGLHPDSVELYKRYANSIKQLHNIYTLKGFAHDGLFDFYPTSYTAAAALLARYGYTINSEHPEPDIFKKSFFKKSYFLGSDRIDSVPNSEIDALSFTTTDNKNYIGWLINAAEQSHDWLRKQDGFVDDKPPTTLLYLLLYHALDLSYIDTSLKLHVSKAVMTPHQAQLAYIEPDFIHVETDNETESRWKHLYKTDMRITTHPDMRLEQYIAQNLDTLDEAAAFRDVLAGLRKLETVPTARLERALMEHIDSVSYRLDTWLLGFLHMQLEWMRNLQEEEGESEPRQGVYLGAYGWLEDLRPENKVLSPVKLPDELAGIFNPDGNLVSDNINAGYILAPSQNHAVTAAVLRNGHLSNEDPEDREELKIKLSSQRVRLALQIIEGIQGGQSLGALLGYQFERGLHDRIDVNVEEFVFELRNAFPLVAKKFTETTPGVDDPEYESISQIEAKNVMDGIAFLEHIEETGNSTYPFGLSLPAASTTQATAINQEVRRLIDINDAVADLALAESVHQVVLGNYERAAATLETYSKGNFPPTPDVIQTPRSGTHLTHRIALQFRTGLSHSLGDAGVTPRMVAEPAMHDWLDKTLPGLDDIVCVVSFINRTTNTEDILEISLQTIGLAAIDVLYLLNVDSDQAMSSLDDLITQHVQAHHTPRLDQAIAIAYTQKLDTSKFTVFEVSSLVASLRALLLRSRSLTATDTRVANEAARENEQTLYLDSARVQSVITALEDLRTHELADFLSDLAAIIAVDDVNAIVPELDTIMHDIAQIFTKVSSYGMPQTGIGFVYQWQQSMFQKLHGKLEALIAQWENRRLAYMALRNEYTAGVGTLTDAELFALLQKAELKLASTVTTPLPATPADYFTLIDGTRFVQFEDILNNTIHPILDLYGLMPLLQAIQTLTGTLPTFDNVGIDIDDELNQVKNFASDLLTGAENLDNELQKRVSDASDLLAKVAGTGDALARVELIKQAARDIFGDDFVMVPEFTLESIYGAEWQNALDASEHSLRYLLDDLQIDFPIDDWLYGISRVREKLYHIENTLHHIEGFTAISLSLVPTQFPYRVDDFWLGLQYPATIPGTDEPFTIDEDKLLYTGIYTDTFNPAQPQCGLVLDEWTEVIPSREETLGLTFHYDQPNSEPPQTLLLATPSDFTGHWRWDDLINTLHETLALAKKRAVEPDHVDTTVYSRFLPPIVSLASPLPLTATLNLALNNKVYFKKVFGDE